MLFFMILKIITKTGVGLDDLKTKLVEKIEAPSIRQAKERVNHWVSMLLNTGLLAENGDRVEISRESLAQVEKDLDINSKRDKFDGYHFATGDPIEVKDGNIDEKTIKNFAENFKKAGFNKGTLCTKSPLKKRLKNKFPDVVFYDFKDYYKNRSRIG